MATFSSLEYGKADFVLLDEITEEQFMANLKLRFQKGKIYSYIGKEMSWAITFVERLLAHLPRLCGTISTLFCLLP